MRPWKLLIAIWAAATFSACSRTAITTRSDAAADAAADASWTDACPPLADAGTATMDVDSLPVPTQDAAPLDAATVGPDASHADASVHVPDAPPSPDLAPDLILPDLVADLASPDLAAPASDSAQPDLGLAQTDVANDANPPDGTGVPNPLGGKTFTIDAATPAPTPNPACTKFTHDEVLTLTFSGNMSTVTINWLSPAPAAVFHGTAGPESSKLTYHLTDAFAGGTVTVERDQGMWVAEFTLLGSGAPVLSCVRSPLSPQP